MLYLTRNTMGTKTFRDILAWQAAYRLVLDVYSLTRGFPRVEIYGLTSQLRRAAVSVTLNIAEGYKRRTKADSLHFYNMAAGSLEEAKCALMIAQDLGYMSIEVSKPVMERAEEASRLLHGWVAGHAD